MGPWMQPFCHVALWIVALGCGANASAQEKSLLDGPGVYLSSGTGQLYLLKSGYFVYGMAMGFAGRGVSSTARGRWRMDAARGFCVQPLPFPALLVLSRRDPERKADQRTLRVDDSLKQSLSFMVGTAYDPRAMSTWAPTYRPESWEDPQQAFRRSVHGEMPVRPGPTMLYARRTLEDDMQAPLIAVALPAGDNDFRIELGEAGNFDLLRSDPDEGGAQPATAAAGEVCNPALVWNLFEGAQSERLLTEQEADEIERSIKRGLDPREMDIGELTYTVLRPSAVATPPAAP